MGKRDSIRRIVRLLIVVLGAGLGYGLALLLLPAAKKLFPSIFESFAYLPQIAIAGLTLLGGCIFFGLSNPIADWLFRRTAALESRWEGVPTKQIQYSVMGLIAGLVVAALVTQLVLSLGSSLITVSVSALCYLLLGWSGLRIGARRYQKTAGSKKQPETPESAPEKAPLQDKLVDTSVLIDGRIANLARTGFLEGRLIVPRCVVTELQRLADSSDNRRHTAGRRGLDVLALLQKENALPILMDETDSPEDADTVLLRLCRDQSACLLTNDYNLNKAASVTGVKVLNLNDLANAMKTAVSAGDRLTVTITKEGKEQGQGVAYLPDGTMVVTEGARNRLGETLEVLVTSALQTSAGRMVFAKLPEEKSE